MLFKVATKYSAEVPARVPKHTKAVNVPYRENTSVRLALFRHELEL